MVAAPALPTVGSATAAARLPRAGPRGASASARGGATNAAAGAATAFATGIATAFATGSATAPGLLATARGLAGLAAGFGTTAMAADLARERALLAATPLPTQALMAHRTTPHSQPTSRFSVRLLPASTTAAAPQAAAQRPAGGHVLLPLLQRESAAQTNLDCPQGDPLRQRRRVRRSVDGLSAASRARDNQWLSMRSVALHRVRFANQWRFVRQAGDRAERRVR